MIRYEILIALYVMHTEKDSDMSRSNLYKLR
jgi:hypothetical protein